MEPASLPTPTKQNEKGRTVWILSWILLLLASADFVVRGPLRYSMGTLWNDLTQYYAASRLWLRGQNFAKPENFVALWHNEVGGLLSANTTRTHIAPPPGALVLFAPIGALPWGVAKVTWLAVLIGGFLATVWALVRTAGFRFNEPRTIAFIAGCLALAPFHTGIAGANQTVLVVAFCAGGIRTASERRDLLAGVLFGAACSLKPHIAAFLVFYYLVRGRWRLFLSAVAFTLLLVVLAVGWMQWNGVDWSQDYFNNIRFGSAHNTIDDFTSANPIRFMLINLQVPLYSFVHNANSANLLAMGIGLVLISTWTVLVLRMRAQTSDLLPLATIAVIGMLPLYHRFYDASVLAIVLCWCVARPSEQLRNIANGALVLMAAFLIPGTAVLQQAARTEHIPNAWINSWWWDRLVMPHQTWLLLLLSLLLLYGMAIQARDTNHQQPVL